MPMLLRSRGLIQALQRALALSHKQRVPLQFRGLNCPLPLATNRSFQVTLSQSYSVAAKTHDDVEHETKSSGHPRGRLSNSLDKILHGISLNVQRTGRVLQVEIRDAKSIINDLGTCTSNQALLLLRCCGSVCVDERMQDRSQLTLSMWKLLQEVGVKLDESHYNALLRAHIENEYDFSPSEFLSWMENDCGIPPNRVTYQHLIARYCAMGDISGATTILEFMKQKDMTVNESVFLSLITGHCKAGDFEAAESVMKIMEDSGIDAGAEAHTALLLGMAKGGKSFEEIKARLDAVTAASVALGDHEYFKLLIELLRAGNRDGAVKVTQLLPKTRGFFQEMRNALPQIIYAGDADLAFEILTNFQMPNVAGQGSSESTMRDHGLFIFRAMVKHEYPPEKVFEMFDKLDSSADLNVKKYMAVLLDVCLDLNKSEYGRNLLEKGREKYGPSVVTSDMMAPFYRGHIRNLATKDEVFDFLKTVDAIGLPVSSSVLSNDVMQKILPSDGYVEPAKVITELLSHLSADRRPYNWTAYINASIQHLFNRETEDGLISVARLLMNVNVNVRPIAWNASLARSYLATGKVDWFVAVLYLCSSHVKNVIQKTNVDFAKDADLFSSLLHVHSVAHRYVTDQSPDQVVLTVLKELKRFHLGVPEATVSLLKQVLAEDSHELLTELSILYDNRGIHLTPERVENALRTFRTFANVSEQKKVTPLFELPTDIEGLDKIRMSLEKRGHTDIRVTSNLIEAYAKEGNLTAIDQLLGETINQRPNYALSPTVVDSIVDGLIQKGNLDEAVKLLKGEEPETDLQKGINKASKFLSTFTNLSKVLAKAERHEDALNLLASLSKSNVVLGNATSNITSLMDYYADEVKDPVRVRQVFDVLHEKGFIEKSGHASPLINVFLNMGDFEGAVVAFENAAKELRKIPQKFRLMEELIKKEDMEKMQRVLDASIGVIGEEKSLYDLALNFLSLGKNSQAKKLLETPGLRYHHDKISRICNYLVDHENLEGLENFVILSQPVFACDREFLYTQLVNAFQDDSLKMTEIWVKMQEEAFIPSDQLKIAMAKAFESDNKPAPFQVPEVQTIPVVKKPKKEVVAQISKPEIKRDPSESIDHYFQTFTDAVEANDSKKAFEEFKTLVESNKFIPQSKVRILLELLEKEEAWIEAGEAMKSLLRRNLDPLLLRVRACSTNILSKLPPEEVKSISDLMTHEKTRKQLKMAAHLQTSES